MKIVVEVLRTRRPLRNADQVERRQDELAHVSCGNHVGEEETDHLAPDDVLFAQAIFPVARTEIDVILEQVEGFDRWSLLTSLG